MEKNKVLSLKELENAATKSY